MRKTLLCAAALLAACGNKRVVVEDRYYSLVLEAAEGRSPLERGDAVARVAITAVTLPDFLLSRSLVLQTSSNEITVARHHHWAEPLDESVRKVLAWDLSEQLPLIDITHGAAKGADCSLAVEFDRLHPSIDSSVLASGRYTLTRGDRVEHREFDVSRSIWADGYTSAVAETRQALAALSQEMQPLVQACYPQAPTD